MAGSHKGSDDESSIKITPRKDIKAPNGTIKLKRPAPKLKGAGNWRDGSVVDDDKKSRVVASPSTASLNSPGPIVNQLDDNARETFATGRPLEDSPEMGICKHCKKSFLKSALKGHVDGCLTARKEAIRKKKELREGKEKNKRKDDGEKDKDKIKAKEKKAAVDDEGDTRVGNDDNNDEDAEGDEIPEIPLKKPAGGLKSAKKSAGKKTEDGEKKGKKRKADGDADKGPKQKKKKEEPKPKAPKPKGPVDVERQCGVITPNGLPCARSLTCKSHSMGAKRAVPGRSLPYDMLLAAYQKKNQAKQQKAAIDANAPLEDEDEANAGPVDSDEETATVMTALSKWNPQPLIPQPILMPIKRRYQNQRLREQLDNATSGGTVNIFKVVSKNGVPLPTTDLDGEDAFGEQDHSIAGGQGSRKASSAFGLQQPPVQRKALQISRT